MEFIRLLAGLMIAYHTIPCSISQVNLVPNSSFEKIEHCATNGSGGEIYLVTPWFNPSHSPDSLTPDFYSPCNNGNFKAPWNAIGNQAALSGSNYAGIDCWGNVFPNLWGEYLEVKLLDTLKKMLCIEFA